VDQVIQVIGAMMILVAYAFAQTGRWETDNRTYLWLNLIGSAILAVLAGISQNWGFLLLESVWAVVTTHSLITNDRSL
jgi:hypothetical protein